jgi:hypothetical protein
MALSSGLYYDLSQTHYGEVTSAYFSKVKWVLVNTTEYSWIMIMIMIILIDRIKLPQHQRIAPVIKHQHTKYSLVSFAAKIAAR